MNLSPWNPKEIKRISKGSINSSTNPVIVVTDQGGGYFKAMGNKEGPQVLACEYVGTSLAKLLGIPTFDFCIFRYTGMPEIELCDGVIAELGPGFLSRAEKGNVWDGTTKQLKQIDNSDDITRLVCVDTWTMNQDRYFPRQDGRSHRHYDNLFFSMAMRKKLTLKAFDFTHAFTNGRDVNAKIVQKVNDRSIYGFFPEFKNFFRKEIVIQVCEQFNVIKQEEVEEIVQQIPYEWEINQETRTAWIKCIVLRAKFLADNLLTLLGLENQKTFSFEGD